MSQNFFHFVTTFWNICVKFDDKYMAQKQLQDSFKVWGTEKYGHAVVIV